MELKDCAKLQAKLAAEERFCTIMERTTAVLAAVTLLVFAFLIYGLLQ
jgi:hypothetical protein